MINKLTKEEEKFLPNYEKKWLDIGMSTGRMKEKDKERLKELFTAHYEVNGLKPATRFVFLSSPCAGLYAASLIAADANIQLDYIYKQTEKFIKGGFNTAKIKSDMKNQLSQCGYGSQDASWLASYDMIWELRKADECKKLVNMFEIATLCGWWWPFTDIVVITEKPTGLHLNEEGRYHKNGGPAIGYGDGFGIWMLNGVHVPQWLAETPKSRLSPKKILGIKNSQVRTEAIRKYGMERLSKYGKLIGTMTKEVGGVYNLIDMAEVMEDYDYAPYLEMTSISVPGLKHFFGIDPSCKTVEEAYNWFFKGRDTSQLQWGA